MCNYRWRQGILKNGHIKTFTFKKSTMAKKILMPNPRIPGLLNYGNVVYLKCAQGGYLTPQNLIWAKNGKSFTSKDISTYF